MVQKFLQEYPVNVDQIRGFEASSFAGEAASTAFKVADAMIKVHYYLMR